MQDWLNGLAMGHHGPYVWSAYGISVSVIIAIHLWASRRQKRLQQSISQLKKEQSNEQA